MVSCNAGLALIVALIQMVVAGPRSLQPLGTSSGRYWLIWVSRQDDSARAVMLFGDRISGGTLQVLGVSHSLTEDAITYDVVLDLTERIGVAIVPGGS